MSYFDPSVVNGGDSTTVECITTVSEPCGISGLDICEITYELDSCNNSEECFATWIHDGQSLSDTCDGLSFWVVNVLNGFTNDECYDGFEGDCLSDLVLEEPTATYCYMNQTYDTCLDELVFCNLIGRLC